MFLTISSHSLANPIPAQRRWRSTTHNAQGGEIEEVTATAATISIPSGLSLNFTAPPGSEDDSWPPIFWPEPSPSACVCGNVMFLEEIWNSSHTWAIKLSFFLSYSCNTLSLNCFPHSPDWDTEVQMSRVLSCSGVFFWGPCRNECSLWLHVNIFFNCVAFNVHNRLFGD